MNILAAERSWVGQLLGDEDDLVLLAADEFLLAAAHEHVDPANVVLLGGPVRMLEEARASGVDVRCR